MRAKFVAGNWKMYKTAAEGAALATAIRNGLRLRPNVEVAVCPPFTALQAVGRAIAGSPVALGAQNLHPDPEGAHTGEISAAMLKEHGCVYVILGHSERRREFGETDAFINAKARAALAAGLTPIVCVGETREEREAGRTEAVLTAQVQGSLEGLGGQLPALVIAYEPVWAIGTGLTATPEQAQSAHAHIRRLLAGLGGETAAAQTRILYGGSVKPDNAADLFSQPDIDGGLIGGASLKADSFLAIVHSA